MFKLTIKTRSGTDHDEYYDDFKVAKRIAIEETKWESCAEVCVYNDAGELVFGREGEFV